jgi:hypothetical protein
MSDELESPKPVSRRKKSKYPWYAVRLSNTTVIRYPAIYLMYLDLYFSIHDVYAKALPFFFGSLGFLFAYTKFSPPACF